MEMRRAQDRVNTAIIGALLALFSGALGYMGGITKYGERMASLEISVKANNDIATRERQALTEQVAGLRSDIMELSARIDKRSR